MAPLEPKDRFALQSASGWLMLGNTTEALKEFDAVSPAARRHPEALLVHWELHSHTRQWTDAIATADQLIAALPDQPEGYIKRAYALHELKRTQEAWDTLQPVSDLFTENWLIPYNLACYAAQLGEAAHAVKLFKRALRLGDKGELRHMALNDPDLQPIRPQIDKLTTK